MDYLGKALAFLNEYANLIILLMIVVVLPTARKLALVYQENKHLSALLTGFSNAAEQATKMLATGALANKAAAYVWMVDYAKQNYPDAAAYLKPDEAALKGMATGALEPVLRATKAVEAAALAPLAVKAAGDPASAAAAVISGLKDARL